MTKRIAACLLVLAAPTIRSWAQVPAGPEFRVNTYATGAQNLPAVASGANGHFVVAWMSPQDGSGHGVFAQRYDATGVRRGGEFRVNTYTTGAQYFPAVGSAANGSFVIAWNSLGQENIGNSVFAQRYDATGAPRGGEFRVNTSTTSSALGPALALDASGNFVVAWASFDGNAYGVFARRYDTGGAPRGTEFRVNTYTTGSQNAPAVASDASGNLVVAWWSRDQDGSERGVFAQRYDSTGAPRGVEFRVNTYTTGDQLWADVALDASGTFVVAWQSYQGQYGGGYAVFAQRFAATGAPAGAEFRVNTYTTFGGFQAMPAVASTAGGSFVVTWASAPQDGGFSVFAQRYEATGAPRGVEFRVNSYTTSNQWIPAVASDITGNFVVAWQSYLQDGSLDGVFAQRFGGLQPQALAADPVAGAGSDGNGVLEPGESVVALRPSWRNVNGAAQTFGGRLLNIGGPPGPGYGLQDPIASYGTVPDGASGQCTDCYAVSVSNPANRPATHWDAFTNETITPDAHGQGQRWLLHIGDSFTDVPRTNPFYRFIETLLHRGLTAGCTATTYCPSNATTREQMSVFVLMAKEGAGYLPPACVPPNIFQDVPETNPFCRYIEELSNRGVVGGCSTGLYCPTDAVTREQMAVFVLRTLDPALSPPACTTPVFADVPASSAFCRWIEELARRGVVSGCGGGNYCPTNPVTREQMGVFLSVTFGLTLYGI